MKITLINPNFSGEVITPSMGLGFIASYLMNQCPDIQIDVIEPSLQNITKSAVFERIGDSDFICATCYTESRFECFDFLAEVKKYNPDCCIIIGGPHCFTMDVGILSHYEFIDIVVRGEGEEAILDIIKKKKLSEIPGITWRDCGKIISNSIRHMNINIDKYSYDYTSFLDIFSGWKDYEIPKKYHNLPSIPIIVSRGCPYKCSFCAAHNIWEIYRTNSIEEIISRIKFLYNSFNIKYFRFYDALFLGNDLKIHQFCDQLEQSGMKIVFRIDVRIGIKYNALKRLKEVGCEVVGFGIESGSDKILLRINKGITRNEIIETINHCKKLKIWSIGFFMVGHPDETLNDISLSYELMPLFDEINIQMFKIHPNTSFYNELVNIGEISNESFFDRTFGFNTMYGNEYYYCHELFPSAKYCFDELKVIMDKGYTCYHLHHPIRLLQRRGLFLGVGKLMKCVFDWIKWGKICSFNSSKLMR